MAHKKVHHRIPEELQTFVIDYDLTAVLIAVALVGQRRESKAWIEPLNSQPLLENSHAVEGRRFHTSLGLRELLREGFGQLIGIRAMFDNGSGDFIEPSALALQPSKRLT